MVYIMRESEEGFYVSIHENEAMPACDYTDTCKTLEEADALCHERIGFRIDWKEPDEDADRDVRLVGRSGADWASARQASIADIEG